MNYGKLPSSQEMNALVEATKGLTNYEFEPGVINYSYAILEKESFNDPLAREFRGMLYDTVAQRPIIRGFHKFFNLDEREENRFENLPWDELVDIQYKLDGSCIMATLYNGRLYAKTKNSMKGELVESSSRMILDNSNLMEILKDHENEVTFIFERLYTSHDEYSGVVTEYPEDELVLLAARNNETGEYYDISIFADRLRINQNSIQNQITLNEIQNADGDLASIKAHIADLKRETHEGFILVFKDRMVKVKTDAYLNQVSTLANLNDREVVRLILDEKLDDIYSFVSQRFHGKYDDRIEGLLEMVISGMEKIDDDVLAFDTQGKQGKELFDFIKDHPYASFISNRARGKYKTDRGQLANMWRKHNLKLFSNTPWNKWEPEN